MVPGRALRELRAGGLLVAAAQLGAEKIPIELSRTRDGRTEDGWWDRTQYCFCAARLLCRIIIDCRIAHELLFRSSFVAVLAAHLNFHGAMSKPNRFIDLIGLGPHLGENTVIGCFSVPEFPCLIVMEFR